MNFINHSLHTDYSKPTDQCLQCQKELALLKQEMIEAQVNQNIEDQYHNHSRR